MKDIDRSKPIFTFRGRLPDPSLLNIARSGVNMYVGDEEEQETVVVSRPKTRKETEEIVIEECDSESVPIRMSFGSEIQEDSDFADKQEEKQDNIEEEVEEE